MLVRILQPYLAGLLASDLLLRLRRAKAELLRKVSQQPHEVSVFISLDDPYSFLLVQVLTNIQTRFDISIRFYLISHLQKEMFPDPEKWRKHSMIDACRLAAQHKLIAPSKDKRLSNEERTVFTSQILELHGTVNNTSDYLKILSKVWVKQKVQEQKLPQLDIVSVSQQLTENEQKLKKMGHYLPASMHYGGEWYWGVDRLSHLEKRLNALGLSKVVNTVLYETQELISKPVFTQSANKEEKQKSLEMFYSARSPYSYLGLERAAALCEKYHVNLVIKPVLPMVMRGMLVPHRKKMVIFHDTVREAKKYNIPYGFVADPLGKPIEHCYALFIHARHHGKELAFLLNFGRAVNAEGRHADQLDTLKDIIERSGLDWEKARLELENTTWREELDQNYNELSSFGFWGVPCFKYGSELTWGQDRLWFIEQLIQDDLVDPRN